MVFLLYITVQFDCHQHFGSHLYIHFGSYGVSFRISCIGNPVIPVVSQGSIIANDIRTSAYIQRMGMGIRIPGQNIEPIGIDLFVPGYLVEEGIVVCQTAL